jgi:hypothetical protein
MNPGLQRLDVWGRQAIAPRPVAGTEDAAGSSEPCPGQEPQVQEEPQVPNQDQPGASPYAGGGAASRSDETLVYSGSNSSTDTLSEAGPAWLNRPTDTWTPEQRAEAVLNSMSFMGLGQHAHAAGPPWLNHDPRTWTPEAATEAALRTIPDWSAAVNQEPSTWTREQFAEAAPRPEWMKHHTDTWSPEQHESATRQAARVMRAITARMAPPRAGTGNRADATARQEGSLSRSQTRDQQDRSRASSRSGRR